MQVSDQEVEAFIRERFAQNLERIQEETHAGLAPDIEAMALMQVLYYWRRLKEIATSVTETEVRLNLPSQRTPDGREYGIEGVVDIVREDEHTIMYDIKTHDASYVRANREEYARQLNIYAYIWQILREQELDETAVITTSFPEKLRESLANRDEVAIEREMGNWEPVVEIPFDPAAVEEAIQEFGDVIDRIEDGEFSPAPVSRLRSRTSDNQKTFATRVCRNCDARFSCRSYRLYMKSASGKKDFAFKTYFKDEMPEWESEERLEAGLELAPQPEILEGLGE